MADASDYDFSRGPTPVSYQVPLATLTYLLRLNELGLVEGPLGDQKLAPEFEQIVWAFHNLLTGGEVEVKITRKGNVDQAKQLQQMLEKAHVDSNQMNRAAGYYITAMV